MNNQNTLELAKLSQQESLQKLDAKTQDLYFNWLNPMPTFLTNQQSINLLGNLPESITKEILNNPSFQNYFQDDIRALKLYVETLPAEQILAEDDTAGYVDPVEFNKFFKENYISTQAYKLSIKDLSDYQSWLSKNQSINKQQAWSYYVSEQIQFKEKLGSSSDLKPNFSLKYFLTDLQPSEKTAYLKQVSRSVTTNESVPNSNSFNFPANSYPRVESEFQSELLKEDVFNPVQAASQAKNSSQSLSFSSEKQEQAQKQEFSLNANTLELNHSGGSTENIKQDVEQANISLQQSLTLQNQVNLQSQNNFSPVTQISNPPIYSPEQRLPDRIPLKSKLKEIGKLNLSSPMTQNRQKGLNYAKIVGYSSAGILSAGSGALAIFNTIFG